MFDAITCAIPGGKRPAQVDQNVAAADLPPLPATTMAQIREIYERRLRPLRLNLDRELDALRHYSLRTRMLGYDGKWALTPDQAAKVS